MLTLVTPASLRTLNFSLSVWLGAVSMTISAFFSIWGLTMENIRSSCSVVRHSGVPPPTVKLENLVFQGERICLYCLTWRSMASRYRSISSSFAPVTENRLQ